MVRIKSAFDPQGVINPGVLISRDALAHLHNIKNNPPIEAIADNCVECGYCEPICPSKDLTTTPRQRIVLRRALANAESVGDKALLNALEKESQYGVEETCAVDGLCESSCPVGINTGSLVKELRARRSTKAHQIIWNQAAQHWARTTKAIGSILTLSSRVPSVFIEPVNKGLRTIFSSEQIPLWSKDLPQGGKSRVPTITPNSDFVLFTSCLGTMFESDTANSLKSLARKAGLTFTTPAGIANLCCGTPWASKGITSGYSTMLDATYAALLIASDNGRIPVVCENSSCSEGLIKAVKTKADSNLHIIDSVDFAADYLLPNLEIKEKIDSLLLHPTCSSTLLGSTNSLERLANALSNNVTIPIDWGCCAFAGDRGMLHPELTASATTTEASSTHGEQFDAYLSTNATCEIGMSRATGKTYQHILCKLDQLAL